MSRLLKEKLRKFNLIAKAPNGQIAEDMIVYKKALYTHNRELTPCIVKLLIPKGTLVRNRYSGIGCDYYLMNELAQYKCRAAKAKVLDIQVFSANKLRKHLKYACSMHTRRSKWCNIIRTPYRVGQMVYPNSFDLSNYECAEGIHFFVTRQEALDY